MRSILRSRNPGAIFLRGLTNWLVQRPRLTSSPTSSSPSPSRFFSRSIRSVILSGTVRIFPEGGRARVREVFTEAGGVLGWWLIGRFSAMTLVGALTWLGPDAPGRSAGVTAQSAGDAAGFYPKSRTDPSRVASGADCVVGAPDPALYVVLLYTVVQMLEGYVITPMIQQRAIQMPLALLITAIVAAGLLFGVLGMLPATPMTAVLLVFVRRFYFEDVPGDEPEARESRKE